MPDGTLGAFIAVDREACLGSGTCIVYAPGTFTHDGDTKAVIIDDHGDAVEGIRMAVEACPIGALRLSNGEGA